MIHNRKPVANKVLRQDDSRFPLAHMTYENTSGLSVVLCTYAKDTHRYGCLITIEF